MEKKNCDVVVIGSGIGGLCTAARLSHAGYKTIVLEMMHILGGRFTFVDYKGYKIPTAAIAIQHGENDPIMRTLKEVGADTSFERIPAPYYPKWRIGGKDHDSPAMEEVLSYLLSVASRDKQEEERVMKAIQRCFLWHEPSDRLTVSEWLSLLTDNRTIHNIFQTWCTQVAGLNIYECPAGEFFRMLLHVAEHSLEVLFVKNGLKTVIDSLEKVITANNGEILTRVRAQKIVVRDGKAVGVEAKGTGGEFQIEAKAVVSNAGPMKTVWLVGEENLDYGYVKEVKDLRSTQGLGITLASNGPLYEGLGVFTPEARRTSLFLDLTMLMPDIAPKGKNLTYVYIQPESTIMYDPKKEYQVFLADLDELFPNFKEQGGEILIAHNHSAEHGAEWTVDSAWPGCGLHHKTPVENLYIVGTAVVRKTGYYVGGSGAAENARIVAEDITARIPV